METTAVANSSLYELHQPAFLHIYCSAPNLAPTLAALFQMDNCLGEHYNPPSYYYQSTTTTIWATAIFTPFYTRKPRCNSYCKNSNHMVVRRWYQSKPPAHECVTMWSCFVDTYVHKTFSRSYLHPV